MKKSLIAYALAICSLLLLLVACSQSGELPEGACGSVEIDGETVYYTEIDGEIFYLNDSGQSYGGEATIENYNFGAERQTLSREEKAERLPDLVAVCMDDGKLGLDHYVGYLYKEDYLDCLYYTEEDYESWPEHQEGIDDFIYFTAYDTDGETPIGVFKRINVKINESCYLSDGTIYLVMDDYSRWVGPSIMGLHTDAELENWAAAIGEDVDDLKAEYERLYEEYEKELQAQRDAAPDGTIGKD